MSLTRVRIPGPEGLLVLALLARVPAAADPPSALPPSLVAVSSITAAWDPGANPPGTLYTAQISTDGFLSVGASSVTLSAFATFTGLTPNTTHDFRVQAGTEAFVSLPSTPTLASPPTPLAFNGISESSFTANWNPAGNPGDTLYTVELSTHVDFQSILDSSSTFLSSATFSGFDINQDFFARLRAFNRASVATGAVLLGAVRTTVTVFTLSADRLAGVYTNASAISFSAQGADHYHYKLLPAPESLVDPAPSFDGSLLEYSLSSAEDNGDFYFNVRGEDGEHISTSFSSFGPLRLDRTAPTVTAVSAQQSATDATPIAPGSPAFARNPRFTWSEPASFSPIVGYSFLVTTDPGAEPPEAVSTGLTFRDQAFSSAGTYYVKVRALDQAGNWGSSASFTFVFTNIPPTTGALPKKNYFNPTLGEKMKVNLQLSQGGAVKVVLYNLRGREVAVLADGELPAGDYDLEWAGRNALGQMVATGVYVIRVEAPGFKKDLKAVVAK